MNALDWTLFALTQIPLFVALASLPRMLRNVRRVRVVTHALFPLSQAAFIGLQMAYALDLKAVIPAGACKEDVSAIISRITDEDEAAPDPGLSRWAHDCGVRFSRFVGHDALLGYMSHQLQGADAGTLYAYAVYLQEKGGSFSDPRRLPAYDGLRRCGEAVAADPALMKSLEGRDADDLRRPNRGTKIYKATAELLKAQKVL